MADRVRAMQAEVDELATRVEDFDRIGEIVNLVLGGIVLGGLLTAWVAIGAAFLAWAGWRLRAGPARATARDRARPRYRSRRRRPRDRRAATTRPTNRISMSCRRRRAREKFVTRRNSHSKPARWTQSGARGTSPE